MDELTTKALEKLKLYRKYLTTQQYKTLKGQILSGELLAAEKGTQHVMHKKRRCDPWQKKECSRRKS